MTEDMWQTLMDDKHKFPLQLFLKKIKFESISHQGEKHKFHFPYLWIHIHSFLCYNPSGKSLLKLMLLTDGFFIAFLIHFLWEAWLIVTELNWNCYYCYCWWILLINLESLYFLVLFLGFWEVDVSCLPIYPTSDQVCRRRKNKAIF